MDAETQPLSESRKNRVCELFQTYSKQRVWGSILFGKDEFPSKESVYYLLDSSQSYIITNGDKHLGFVIVTPSVFVEDGARSYAEIRVLPETDIDFEEAFVTLLSAGMHKANLLGYEACIYEAFSSNPNLIGCARQQGFYTLAVLPRCGYVFDQGWQESFVLMKMLCNLEKSVRTRNTSSGWHKTFISARTLNMSLPVTLNDKKGIGCMLDLAKPSDLDKVYDLYAQASNSGNGYTKQDIPTKESLEAIILNPGVGHLFVFRDGKQVAAALFVEPSIYSRSASPICCDHWIVVSRTYSNIGLMTKNGPTIDRLSLSLGYEGTLSSVYTCNLQALHAVYHMVAVGVGIIPYSGYLTGKGWMDMMLIYRDYRTGVKKSRL